MQLTPPSSLPTVLCHAINFLPTTHIPLLLLLPTRVLTAGEKPHTMSAEWKAANKDYMRFLNINPIFGISSKK